MNRLINFMLTLPVEMLAEGVGLIAKAMKDFQIVFDETANLIIPPHSTVEPVDLIALSSPLPARDTNAFQIDNPSLLVEEIEPMYDDDHHDSNDLSGDDLKYVSYSIIFTKRDYEATLVTETEEVVDYDTDSGAFGALKISELFESFPKKIPREWQDGSRGRPGPDEDYQFDQSTGTYGRIPQEDRKYLRFVCKVIKRIDKSEKEYDRDQRDSQRRIAENIGRIADSI